MRDLEVGAIYIGEIHTKPVRFMGLSYDVETISLPLVVLWQFEYVLKEHLPGPKGGVCGYGQTEEQMVKENYTVVETLDVLYGHYDKVQRGRHSLG